MSIVPEGPMPEEMVTKLRERLEDGIASPKLCAVVTIDNDGLLEIFQTWQDKRIDLAVAQRIINRKD